MSDPKDNDKSSPFHFEGGIPILNTRLSEIERKQAEAEARDKNYKDEQMGINRRLVNATIALVVATIVMAIIGIVQVWYIHRQWKLTSAGLSMTGDQIWASKDAAYASKKASDTASQALADSESSFDKTLTQMQAQTRAQRTAAQVADQSLKTTQNAFRDDQRAWIGVVGLSPFNLKVGESPSFSAIGINIGKTPAINTQTFIAAQGILRDSKIEFTYVPIGMRSRSVVVPSSQLSIGPSGAIVPFTSAQINDITSGRVVVYVYGKVMYEDVFRRGHQTTFCFVLKDWTCPHF